MPDKKKKILFVSEAATLAHVARPLALSVGLDPARFDLAIACAPRSHWLLRDFPGEKHPLESIDGARFLDALAKGKPVYDKAMLQGYVRDDLALLEKVRPDVVVGDFRLSLSISARLAKIPYVAISNCYWSPYWRPEHYPVPNLPLTHILPIGLADLLFQVARPIAFALHTRPLNAVRRDYKLPSLGTDLRRVYTDADYVVYADIAQLFPSAALPSNHRFIGPVLWSPPIVAPDWWHRVPENRPIVYVTLGSSGLAQLLPRVLKVLESLDVTVIASTAGASLPEHPPANALVAPYLPGDAAARRASLVICNGGSPTSHQALAAGVPVIGVVGNLDQFLNMGTISDAGAGELMRADRFRPKELEELVIRILGAPSYKAGAEKIRTWFEDSPAPRRFSQLIEEVV